MDRRIVGYAHPAKIELTPFGGARATPTGADHWKLH
jgi:hypothetical protein